MDFSLYGAGPLAGLAVISLALAAAFAYLAGYERRVDGLRPVALAYAFNALRFLLLAWAPFDSPGATRLAADLANVTGAVLLVYGALRMAGVQRSALRSAVVAALAALLLAAAQAGGERIAGVIATSLLGACAQAVFAWALFRLARDSRLAGYCVAGALALALAALRLFLPVLVRADLQSFAVLMAGVLYVGTAVALIVAMQHAQLSDLGRARSEAVKAQRFARVVFQSTVDLMAVARVENDGRFIMEHANTSLLKAVRAAHPGRSMDPRQGRDLEEALRVDLGMDEDKTGRILHCFREAVRTGVPQPINGAFGLRQQEAMITPITGEDGRVEKLFYRGTDVTAARNAEEELRRSHERFKAILENAPVAIAITRIVDGRFVYVNPAYSAVIGASRERMIGSSAMELGLWSAEDRQRLVLDRQDAEGRVQVEKTFQSFDGRRVDAVLSIQALEFDGEGCLLTMAQDVTEATESRKRAAELSERFMHLFNVSPVPLVVTRMHDGRYLEMNDAWLQFYGFTREQAVGRTTVELGIWESQQRRQALVDLLERDGLVQGFSNRIRTQSDEPRDVLLFGRTLDWNGERAIVGFEVDVTQANRAKGEIERLNASLEGRVRERTAELEQALSEMEAFTYTVSHDLRAPLRAMTSFSDLLARSPSLRGDEQAVAYAGRVSRAASRMGRMVDALLRHARLARETVRASRLPLRAEAESIAVELASAYPQRRIRWSFGELPEVRADRGMLRLVLHNLMDNAVKFTGGREEARIELAARQAGNEVEVEVRDNGVGFDMAFADKLFAPFQRLHEESEYEGIGIGLAHARRVVERHGGRIWCTAAPGAGAAFAFSLPA